MRKTCTTLLVCLMVFTMSMTAFAAEQPQTVVETGDNGTSITITDITPREDETDEQKEEQKTEPYKVGSYYPVEIQTAEDNGYQLLVKTFIVPQGVDPSVLIEEGLIRRGVAYQVSDILCRELDGDSETRTATETVTMPVESDDKDELLELFDAEMTYSEDGFSGTLQLNERSITAEATDTEGYSYTLKDVKEYTGLERNDPYYIPKTAEKYGVTLKLADIKWTPMASGTDNSRSPSLFKATAIYTGTAWGSKETDFVATATYTGEVSKVTEGDLVYSIIYEELPTVIVSDDEGASFVAGINWGGALLTVLGIVAGAAVIAAIVYGIKWLLRKREENAESREQDRRNNDPYADRPDMDLPDMLYDMDRGLEDDR